MNEEMHQEFLQVNGLTLILNLAEDSTPHVRLYLSDIVTSLIVNGIYFY